MSTRAKWESGTKLVCPKIHFYSTAGLYRFCITTFQLTWWRRTSMSGQRYGHERWRPTSFRWSPYQRPRGTGWWNQQACACTSARCGSLWPRSWYRNPENRKDKAGLSWRNLDATNRLYSRTLMGLRLRMTKLSARWAKKRINFLAKISSNSSACLTQTLMRMELMEPSMRTFSFSLRAITIGLSKSSLLVLQQTTRSRGQRIEWKIGSRDAYQIMNNFQKVKQKARWKSRCAKSGNCSGRSWQLRCKKDHCFLSWRQEIRTNKR